MNTCYECLECYRIFDKEDAYSHREVDREEFWGEMVDRVSVVDECPYCSSDQLEEIALCSKCDLNPVKEGYDWCEECEGKYCREPTTLDPWMDALSAELKEMGP